MTARPSPSSSETAADPVHSFPPDKQRPTTVRQQTTDLLLPSPFPPLSLMHDTTQTVTHALAQSQLAAGAERAAKGKGKAEAVPPASGEAAASHTTKTRRWKAGLAPGQAAKKLFPKPNALVRAHRRFFIKRDLKYVRLAPFLKLPLTSFSREDVLISGLCSPRTGSGMDAGGAG